MLSIEEITTYLATYLLQLKEGERLQSVRSFAQELNASVGTVSNALTSIEAANAVTIDRRGHMGSYLVKRSLGDLWMLAEHEPLVIAFPLIANPRLEGLATALKKQLRDAGLDVYLIFIRGSRTRAKALREKRCHIAVMSKFAADEVCTAHERVLLTMPGGSYVSGHEVFYRPGIENLTRPLRVAIDNESTDVSRLTRMEFADQDIEFKPITFMQLPRLLTDGVVDVGVWSSDDMKRFISPEILHRPFSAHVSAEVGDSSTSATLIASAEHASVQAVVQGALDWEALIALQRRVMDGELVPEY